MKLPDMTLTNMTLTDDGDDDDLMMPPSIYDDEKEEEDLWFLPPDPDDEDAKEPFFFDSSAWFAAERNYLTELSEITFHLGMLSQKLKTLGQGALDRLVRMEAVELSWAAGERLPFDKLHFYLSLRKLSTSPEQLAILQNVTWAYRAYHKGCDPMEDDIRILLERQEVTHPADRHLSQSSLSPNSASPSGLTSTILSSQMFTDRFGEWFEAMSQTRHLHPVTRSALAFFMWQAIEVTGRSSLYEGAVVAQKLGRYSERNFLGFLPLASAGHPVFQRVGTIEERLARWIKGATNASLRCLLEIERVEDWYERASPVVESKRGTNLALTRQLFVDYPMISSELMTERLGVSHATAMRLIESFTTAGLVKEVTGNSRFRLWRCKLV
jgi:hypothetical protein